MGSPEEVCETAARLPEEHTNRSVHDQVSRTGLAIGLPTVG